MPATADATLAPVVPIRAGRRRALDVLHPAMASRYTALVASVAPDIERRLSPNALANRVVFASADPPVLALRGWRTERRTFVERLHRLARSSRVIVFTDVARCYPSIGAPTVGEALAACGSPPGMAARVEELVASFGRVGLTGLPVGPNASAVLANGVLASLDDELERAGRRWIRWVDDVVIASADAEDADEALAVVDHALRAVGLERNLAKTRLVVPGAVGEGAIELSAMR